MGTTLNLVFVATYQYKDDVSTVSYADVYKNLDDAVKDAKLAQLEFIERHEGACQMTEAVGFGIFDCSDNKTDALQIRIEEKFIR